MKRRKNLFVYIAVFAACSVAAGIAGHPALVPASASGARSPIIVELFTSEGCSSCPPADTLLAQLVKTQPIAGAEVIALSEHVDYWDHGGWADPYSSHAFTVRQSGYATKFGGDAVYTPQMIVDGGVEFVGSDRDRALAAIAAAVKAPKASVTIRRSGNTQGKMIPLHVQIDHFPPVATGGEGVSDIYLVVTENGLTSYVNGGENRGRTLNHSSVVRHMQMIGHVNSSKASVFNADPYVTLAPKWNPQNVQVIVFAQNRASHRILGAGILGL